MCLRARRSPKFWDPLEHLRWYAAFHHQENGVHIHHGEVISSNHQEGYLTKQGIRQGEVTLGRFGSSEGSAHIYEQKPNTGTPWAGMRAAPWQS